MPSLVTRRFFGALLPLAAVAAMVVTGPARADALSDAKAREP